MGLTKHFMEFEEEREAARAALQELLDIGRIGHPSTVRVAERVVADGNLDGLDPLEREVFERFVAPKLRLSCETCLTDIPVACYPEVIASPGYEGKVLCDACLAPR